MGLLQRGLGGGGGDTTDDGGVVESFTRFATRNTDELVSGTNVSRDTAEDVARDLYGDDYQEVADDYSGLPEDGDATGYPEWRQNWVENAELVDDLPTSLPDVPSVPDPTDVDTRWLLLALLAGAFALLAGGER